jgi:ABC-type Zn2+ transport system substrate-binding protein/surface adhesin
MNTAALVRIVVGKNAGAKVAKLAAAGFTAAQLDVLAPMLAAGKKFAAASEDEEEEEENKKDAADDEEKEDDEGDAADEEGDDEEEEEEGAETPGKGKTVKPAGASRQAILQGLLAASPRPVNVRVQPKKTDRIRAAIDHIASVTT